MDLSHDSLAPRRLEIWDWLVFHFRLLDSFVYSKKIERKKESEESPRELRPQYFYLFISFKS